MPNPDLSTKKFRLELKATVLEVLPDGSTSPLLTQDMTFNGLAPAIHPAVSEMGKTFMYGLSVSLSRQVMGILDDEDAKRRAEKSAPPAGLKPGQ